MNFRSIKQLLMVVPAFMATVAAAQENGVTLTGTLTMQTGETFPYKLVVTENKGKIAGFSYTYDAPNDTKSAVTGTLDRLNKTLTFKETAIVYSGGYHTRAFMCLIDARLNYVQGGMGNVLKGGITSKEADKTQCTGGELTFNQSQELNNLFSYHDAFDTVITMKKKAKPVEVPVPTAGQEREPEKSPEDEVTKGVIKTYDWHSDSVIIDIWDGGQVDGDKVSVLYNGKPCLYGYTLARARKRITIPVSRQGIDNLEIVADDEGTDPPNTANLLLTDGYIHYSVRAYNKKGDRALIRIQKAAREHSTRPSAKDGVK